MSVPDTVRHGARQVIFEDYPQVGFNYRMTDIQAAVGRVQLRRLPGLLEERRRLAENYTWSLAGMTGLEPPFVPPGVRSNYQSYALRVTPEYPLGRDALMQELLRHGVSTRRGIMNAHQEGACADLPPRYLPCSEAARDSVILLPLFPGMTEREQQRMIDCLRRAATRAKAG
jgi:dTDP-4-amino-4,6-dideoxygalactose transaminase